MTRFFGKNRSFVEGLQIWRFAVFAALAMIVPYLTVAKFLGPEFPSLIGGLVGLGIVVTAARKGFLIRHQGGGLGFRCARAAGSRRGRDAWKSRTITTRTHPMGMFRAWLPYALVGALLVLTRVLDPFSSVGLRLGRFRSMISLGRGFPGVSCLCMCRVRYSSW